MDAVAARETETARELVKSSLERQQHVEHLLAVARLLHVGDLAAAAVGDAGLGDLGERDGVVGVDVLGADDAGDYQFADLEIDALISISTGWTSLTSMRSSLTRRWCSMPMESATALSV